MAILADKIAAAGDWHGNTIWAEQCLVMAHKAGIKYVFHTGDAAPVLLDRANAFFDKLQHTLAYYDQVLLITEGNHENYDLIAQTPPTDRGDGLGAIRWVRDNIAYLPRGHRLTIDTTNGVARTLVTLGGAPSLDADNRVEGVTWWKQEAIGEMDVLNTTDGGTADIMVAHEAPGAPYQTPGVADIRDNNDDWGWPAKALAYAAEQRYLITKAFEGVCPRLYLHGHYHTRSTAVVDTPAGHACTMVALPRERQAGNLVAIDTDTLAIAGLTNPAGF